jgi:hypothetical protein
LQALYTLEGLCAFLDFDLMSIGIENKETITVGAHKVLGAALMVNWKR